MMSGTDSWCSIGSGQLLQSYASCTRKCRSSLHASACMRSAMRAETLHQMQCFLLLTCRNFYNIHDERHRSLVHWAAASGNVQLLEWLITQFHVDINHKESESHYTPLHLALLHGHIATAQCLINHGASMITIDNEGLNALELIHKDQSISLNAADPTQVYTFGENVSFNLGHKNATKRLLPEPVDYFARLSISIKKVSLAKLHTLFLTKSGDVYSCGHGLGGRLGFVDEQSRVHPQQIIMPGTIACVDIAAALGHSLFVGVDGSVMTCGQNENGCLGVSGDEMIPTPIIVPLKDSLIIVGCAAASRHSVIWSKCGCVLTCGRNTHGQLGHSYDSKDVVLPIFSKIPGYGIGTTARQSTSPQKASNRRSTTSESRQRRRQFSTGEDQFAIPDIKFSLIANRVTSADDDSLRISASASDECTVVAMNNGDIRLYTEFECRIIGRKRLEWRSVHVSDEPTVVLMLSISGKVFVWERTSERFRPISCTGLVPKNASFRDVALAKCGAMVLISEDGMAYQSRLSKNDLPSNNFQTVSVQKHLSNVHRALYASISRDGQNVAIIQRHPSVDLTELPSISSGLLAIEMRQLFDDARDDDNISDLIVRSASTDNIPVHRFVLFSKSAKIRLAIEQNATDGVWQVDINNFVMRQLLLYLYTDWCDLLDVGFSHSFSVKSEVQNRKKQGKVTEFDPIAALSELAKKFAIRSLQSQLDAVRWRNGKVCSIRRTAPAQPRFDICKAADCIDIEVICADSISIMAHRCILSARLEYFRSMMKFSWKETIESTVSFPLPSIIARPLFHYLYTDEYPDKYMNDEDSSELIYRLLIAADQYLVDRLKEMCEVRLSAIISLRNVHELMYFAETYNAGQLQLSCMQFIALNLPALIDSNQLYAVDNKCLSKIGEIYRRQYPMVDGRRLTPGIEGWPNSNDMQKIEAIVDSAGVTIDDLVSALRDECSMDTTCAIAKKATKKTKTAINDSINNDENAGVVPRSPTLHVASVIPDKSITRSNIVTDHDYTIQQSVVMRQQSSDDKSNKRSNICPWATISSSPPTMSLKDVIAFEEKLCIVRNQPNSTTASITKKKTIGWTLNDVTSTSNMTNDTPIHPRSLTDIQHDEQLKQLEQLKSSTKSLEMIQLEELAMRQLLSTYDVDDELISVERVNSRCDKADPLWKRCEKKIKDH